MKLNKSVMHMSDTKGAARHYSAYIEIRLEEFTQQLSVGQTWPSLERADPRVFLFAIPGVRSRGLPRMLRYSL